MNSDPDYLAAYVIIETNDRLLMYFRKKKWPSNFSILTIFMNIF